MSDKTVTTEVLRLRNWLEYIRDNIPIAETCCEDALAGKNVFWWRTKKQQKQIDKRKRPA